MTSNKHHGGHSGGAGSVPPMTALRQRPWWRLPIASVVQPRAAWVLATCALAASCVSWFGVYALLAIAGCLVLTVGLAVLRWSVERAEEQALAEKPGHASSVGPLIHVYYRREGGRAGVTVIYGGAVIACLILAGGLVLGTAWLWPNAVAASPWLLALPCAWLVVASFAVSLSVEPRDVRAWRWWGVVPVPCLRASSTNEFWVESISDPDDDWVAPRERVRCGKHRFAMSVPEPATLTGWLNERREELRIGSPE